MDAKRITHLQRLWARYQDRMADLDEIRAELDDEIGQWIVAGVRQADIARLLDATRQDVQESVRRQQRRRDRGEIT